MCKGMARMGCKDSGVYRKQRLHESSIAGCSMGTIKKRFCKFRSIGFTLKQGGLAPVRCYIKSRKGLSEYRTED